MPEYTVAAAISVVVVLALELAVLRTGLFGRPAYWLTVVIVWAFQVPVDGWLTKLSAPVVLYAPDQASGIRVPWDIPVEDFAFGFSLITFTLLLWERLQERPRRSEAPPVGRADSHDPAHDQANDRARDQAAAGATSRPRPPASPGQGPGPGR